jgi:dUTP pyrophosphatase
VDEVKIPVRRLDPGLMLPEYAHQGDAGADLRASEEVELPPLGRALVRTGLAVAIPDGYAAFVHPRSGLASRHGVTVANAPGTIDAGYRGEVRVVVNRGDRIAQLVVQAVAAAQFLPVDELPETGRSDGGFGSTGR